jgi:hypothetical protein
MKTKTKRPMKTYWSGNGKHQKKLRQLEKEFVPPCGECKELAAEVFRMAGRLYYDMYNGGGCNISGIDDDDPWHMDDGDFAIAGRSLAILKYAIDDEEYYDIRRLTLDTAKYYAEIDNPVWDLLQQPLESVLDKVVVWAWDTLKGESK